MFWYGKYATACIQLLSTNMKRNIFLLLWYFVYLQLMVQYTVWEYRQMHVVFNDFYWWLMGCHEFCSDVEYLLKTGLMNKSSLWFLSKVDVTEISLSHGIVSSSA